MDCQALENLGSLFLGSRIEKRFKEDKKDMIAIHFGLTIRCFNYVPFCHMATLTKAMSACGGRKEEEEEFELTNKNECSKII
jgi:hypothetical protein